MVFRPAASPSDAGSCAEGHFRDVAHPSLPHGMPMGKGQSDFKSWLAILDVQGHKSLT